MSKGNKNIWVIKKSVAYWLFGAAACALGFNSHAASLQVSGSDGSLITNYRWLIQEDTTKPSVPGDTVVPGTHLSVSMHTSYAPVVAKGDETTPLPPVDANPPAGTLALDPAKRYFVSVLPNASYSNGGGALDLVNPTKLTVNALSLPAAQISVFVFEDNAPLNNTPDLPAERGLPRFSIQVFDAGGTYGASGGRIITDVFGNPLGSEYDANGNLTRRGKGVILTDGDGVARIKNLAPGKYTIFVAPPSGKGWVQTATIEGTPGVDAWVKANEPSFFQEFGAPGHHVFIGFTKARNDIPGAKTTGDITGRIVNMHMSRSPDYAFYGGDPVNRCWVGLNEMAAGGGRNLFAAPCDADSTFTIPKVPVGRYQLVVWDETLDVIFATHTVDVPPGGGEVDLADVPVFNWFGKLKGQVFHDVNGNGFRDPGDTGLSQQALNLRFRDGSIYQMQATDAAGEYEFPEVFPFFNWLVAEVDYARLKPTGATVVVDAGGPVNPDQGWTMPTFDVMNPQAQCNAPYDPVTGECPAGQEAVNPNTGNNLSRTETGPVLVEGIQTFLGQTNVIDWGKQTWGPGENGGISGIVHYATTRAEDDPAQAAAENWEPGIPRVQVNLYQDNTGPAGIPDKIIDDLNGDGAQTLADVDNWPFGWNDGTAPKGLEDIDRNGNTSFDLGDAVDITYTDSFDDNLPAGCQGEVFNVVTKDAAGNVISQTPTDCFDGLRNFNQVRPTLFDGGYAFGTPAGKPTLPAGTYIVEAVTPPGYEHQKEEDKNVVFGDSYVPTLQALPPACVNWDDVDNDGQPGHTVPPYLTLFPDAQEPAPFAGQNRPVCDRKQVRLTQGQNTPADFNMFTETPVAGQIVGMILNDLANEFDPNAPNFGEKYAPPHMPISIRDWTGREISRVYSDQYGTYNALVPSTYTANIPMASGMSPNMLTACLNSPMMPDPANPGQMIPDPFHNKQYTQFCYTFQYMPGKTTYLDTPVLPIAAMAGPGRFPLDCEYGDGTPMIHSVTNNNSQGPWISTAPNANRTISITAVGPVAVTNPAAGAPGATPTILRDYGFGTGGTVGIRNADGIVIPLTNVTWGATQITGTVPANWRDPATGKTYNIGSGGQLVVTRTDTGRSTVNSVTVTVGGLAPIVVKAGDSIQAAIDAAAAYIKKNPNARRLITVSPGVYEELPIMHAPVQLQGFGPGSVTINAVKAPAEKLQDWRTKIASLLATEQFDLAPDQAAPNPPVDPANNEPNLFGTDEGAGITVVANVNEFRGNNRARIDGFTITGSDIGGAIYVNGYASNLEISNNRLISNQGTFGGGIHVGNALLDDSNNDNVNIHHNQVTQNGSLDGAGGGISLYAGSTNYQVTGNFVCGNFAMGGGGGIGHLGLSNNGRIAGNTVLFNESFKQAQTVNGGGILISGQPAPAGELSPGAGNLTVEANLIQGNLAGAGDGGGLRTQFVNGLDVRNGNPTYRVNVIDNIIVNNIAGLAGGGISMQDTARIYIDHNTIANNDSTATAGEAFAPSSPNKSTEQIAGVVARKHSSLLATALRCTPTSPAWKCASAPLQLANNIIWHNRSFYWEIANYGNTSPSGFGLKIPTDPTGTTAIPYNDLGIVGSPLRMSPVSSILTDTTGYATSNNSSDPLFVKEYLNTAPGQNIQQPEFTVGIGTAPAFDEGGNFIDINFGPLSQHQFTALGNPVLDANGRLLPNGDYHIQLGSPAIGLGSAAVLSGFQALRTGFDGQLRPTGVAPDAGAGAAQ